MRAMSDEHIGYSIICEELEEWDGPEEYDPERDGELEWYETEIHLSADGNTNDAPFEDYVRVAHELSECVDVRNVRIVEVVRVEREVEGWRTM